MQAVILAGGMGTRLKSVISDRPKPMALIHGKPFLEYQIRYLKQCGMKNIVICAGYLGSMIESYFGNGEGFGVRLDYSHEQEPLGTAGAVRNAERLLEEDFVVLNGDTYYTCDYEALIRFHLNRQSALTISMVPGKSANDYGSVMLNEECRITGFSEKMENGSGLISTGVYVMNREVLNRIPPREKVSFENDLIPGLVKEKAGIFGCLNEEGLFIDIGVPERYFYFLDYARRFELI